MHLSATLKGLEHPRLQFPLAGVCRPRLPASCTLASRPIKNHFGAWLGGTLHPPPSQDRGAPDWQTAFPMCPPVTDACPCAPGLVHCAQPHPALSAC